MLACPWGREAQRNQLWKAFLCSITALLNKVRVWICCPKILQVIENCKQEVNKTTWSGLLRFRIYLLLFTQPVNCQPLNNTYFASQFQVCSVLARVFGARWHFKRIPICDFWKRLGVRILLKMDSLSPKSPASIIDFGGECARFSIQYRVFRKRCKKLNTFNVSVTPCI